MRVTMHGLHADRVGALRQAEGGAAVGIEPVCDVANAVLLLDLHVASVGDGEVHGRNAGDIVAVEKQRYGNLSDFYESSAGSCRIVQSGWPPYTGAGSDITVRSLFVYRATG